MEPLQSGAVSPVLEKSVSQCAQRRGRKTPREAFFTVLTYCLSKFELINSSN